MNFRKWAAVAVFAASALVAQIPVPVIVDSVAGGSNLTTAGAVTFVGAPNVLTSDEINFFWDSFNYRLGIGTATPTAPLTVTGSALIEGLTVGRGGGALSSNTAVGASALAANTTGSSNTATGLDALAANTTGASNTAFGREAMRSNTTGSNNVGVGHQAGETSTSANANTTGSNNTWIGYQSGPASSTQRSGSVAIGAGALVNASNAGVLGTSGMKWSVGGVQAPATTFHVEDTTASTGVTNVLVKAGGGQSTTDLLKIQNSSGTDIALVGSRGWAAFGEHTTAVTSQNGSLTTNPLQIRASGGNQNLLTNQLFDEDLSGWSITGSDWVWNSSGGGARHVVGNTTSITQDIQVVAGVTYAIGVNIRGRSGGTTPPGWITISIGSATSTMGQSGNDIYGSTRYVTANSTGTQTLSITPTSDFDGTIRVVLARNPGSVLEIRNNLSGSNAAPLNLGISFRTGAFFNEIANIWAVNRDNSGLPFRLSFGLNQGSTSDSVVGRVIEEVFRLDAGTSMDGFAVMSGRKILSANVADGIRSNFTFSPTYSGAFTVTRHNYISLDNPVLQNSAVLTNAAVFRFNAAAGTHAALASGTTRPSSEVVDAYVKINVNGAIRYIPAYSTTAGTAAAGSFTTVQATSFSIGAGTEATCDATTRGQVVMVQGGAGVADTLRICRKDAADAYAWTALY